MIQIAPTWASAWKVEDKGKYAHVSLSTSRKDNRSDGGGYLNSSWGDYISFAGEAYGKIPELIQRLESAQVGKSNKQPVRIHVLSGGVKRESYEKDGETVYPKREQIVIFNFEFDGDAQDNPVAPPADDDIPF